MNREAVFSGSVMVFVGLLWMKSPAFFFDLVTFLIGAVIGGIIGAYTSHRMKKWLKNRGEEGLE